MRGSRTTTAFLAATCLTLAAVSPALRAAPAPQVFQPPFHAGGPVQCNDAYYEYLPGILNFCLGVHDWESGRYKNAIGWLKLAAGWGSKGAQYMLGLMYYDGNHVTQNRPLGIAWLQLANERRNNGQIEVVTRSAITYATPDELHRADALFQKMRPRYGDKVAALRAWTEFRHYSELVAYELGGGLGGSGSGACIFMPAAQAGTLGQPMPAQAAPPLDAGAHSAGAGRPHMGGNADAGSGQACVSSGAFNASLSALANHYFKGWEGRVTVEPLHPVSKARSQPAR